jgi:LemA protein
MTVTLILGIIFFLIIVLVLYAVTVYNKLISLKARVNESSSDIDVQLKRRYDLIPNLVETVKGSTKFEQETLEKVIKARQQAIDITGLGENKAIAENQLSGALRQLFALSESYPDLKSNQNFAKLQDELTNTEDRLSAARRFYNSTVKDYNVYQMQFPAILFRGLAGATEAEFFEVQNQEERENVKVNF